MFLTCAQNQEINSNLLGDGSSASERSVLRASLEPLSHIPQPCAEPHAVEEVTISKPRRGRPRLPRCECPLCGRSTRLTHTYCCQHCGHPRTPAGTSGDDLRSVWITWVASHLWTDFGTGTLPWPMDSRIEHERLAIQNYARRFFNKLRRCWQPDIAWFAVPESDPSGQLHLHWISWSPNIPSGVMRDAWKAKYEGFAKVGPYTSGASVYSCKTLGNSDMHFVGGSWRRH